MNLDRSDRSERREAYREALDELSEYGPPPDELAAERPASFVAWPHPSGFYGERNWDWEGVQRGPHSGKGPKGYRRSDERLREDVSESLSADGDLDASEISVEVADGEVTLEGTVVDRPSKRHAENLAERVAGVRDVHNRLRIAR
jgi:hypothetical protein